MQKQKSIKSIVNLLNQLKLNGEMSNQIIEDFENINIELRVCSKCGNIMSEGYIISGGDSYYCSDNCKNSEIEESEWNKLTAYLTDEEERSALQREWFEEYGDTDSYWTEWN